ncbi:MAG: adenosine deaminase [Clostridiales bacterium]|nr:adenosine deaminase [Clostridiales bacterium]
MKYDFPKLDLHLHLDGSMLPESAWEMAKERGVKMPADNLEDFKKFIIVTADCRDVNEYLEKFELPLQIMQDKEAIIRTARELVIMLASQGLVYAEIRFAPQLHMRKGLTQDDAIEAVLEGVKQGMEEAKTIDIGVICCAMSVGLETVNKEENLETIRATKRYLGKGVVAADLAGAEGIVPLRNFGYVFDLARELNVPFTCHAGDSDGPQTAWDALAFGTKRIGHGHRVYDDKELIKKCIEDNVTLEICPTSNIQCQSQPSYAEHPAKKLLDMGVRVTINTDNMVLSDINLDKEYDHCLNDMGFEYNDLIKMNINSVEAAFMPEEKKQPIINKLKTYYK